MKKRKPVNGSAKEANKATTSNYSALQVVSSLKNTANSAMNMEIQRKEKRRITKRKEIDIWNNKQYNNLYNTHNNT